MRSLLTTLAPAASVASSMWPSTCAGTPDSSRCGAGPSRAGQFRRTISWLPPMPPAVTTTACAVIAKSPISVRELASPRATPLPSSTAPRTPVTAPSVTSSSDTRCRKRSSTRPASTAARTRRAHGSTTPGRVPQTMWKRGTELPGPVAVYPPRSAQPTTGKKPMPCSLSQARFSPAANCRYASAHSRGQWSDARSKPAVPNQSCRASSRESCTRSRRCSGESMRNRPPKLHQAWPPRDASGSCSRRMTRLPASASSAVATRPASPAPTTTTSVSLLLDALSVLTGATLAGGPRRPPSPRRATRPARTGPPPDGPLERQHQAAQRPHDQQQRGPDPRGAAEHGEDGGHHREARERQAGRQGEPQPAAGTPGEHQRGASQREDGKGEGKDQEPVPADPRRPEQSGQVHVLARDQHPEEGGERDGEGTPGRRGVDPTRGRPGRAPRRRAAAGCGRRHGRSVGRGPAGQATTGGRPSTVASQVTALPARTAGPRPTLGRRAARRRPW